MTYKKTKKAMFSSREVVQPSRSELVNKVWNLENEAILVTYDLLPRHQDIGLEHWLPFRPRLDPNLEDMLESNGHSTDKVNHKAFLNHGKLIQLDSKANREKVTEWHKEKRNLPKNYKAASRLNYGVVAREKLSPEVLRIAATERLSIDDAVDPGYAGMAWKRLENGQQNIIHLTEIMEGLRIYLTMEIDAKYYWKPEHINKYGLSVLARVPNTHGEFAYIIRMDHIPYNKEMYAWFDFNTEHSCAMKSTEFSFQRKTRKNIICRHEAAGIYALMEKIVAAKRRKISEGELHPREILPNQIIPLPTDKMIDFYLNLKERVRIIEPKMQKGKIVNRTRPLNSAEIEKLCWETVTRHGHRQTLWRKSKLSNYQLPEHLKQI